MKNAVLAESYTAIPSDRTKLAERVVERFYEAYLLPCVHEDLQRLADMVYLVSDFPRPSDQFRHVWGSQDLGGLGLCKLTSSVPGQKSIQ